MSVRIIRATEAVTVAHPIFLIYGQPGLCKSSLGFSAKDPILLNFDSESALARTVNRRDAIDVLTVDDFEALCAEQREVLHPFSTVVIDTVGCCINMMVAALIHENPKLGRADGGLTQTGFGALKNRFSRWMREMRELGKDIVFIAHQKEDKNNDVVFMRPEIMGGSKDEVLRLADCVGYVYMSGKNRVIDFNPTEQWFGKNPAGWSALKVPPIAKATDFLAGLIEDSKQAMGKVSEASAAIALQVGDWRDKINTLVTAEEMNRALPDVARLSPLMKPQVVKILDERRVAIGIVFDKTTKQFVGPQSPAPQRSQLEEAFA